MIAQYNKKLKWARPITGKVDFLATCILKPIQIVISCDPEFYCGRPVSYGKM